MELRAFGSFVTKLYLPHADIDLVVVHQSEPKSKLMKTVASILQRYPSRYSNLNLISSAKVPIIRFIDTKHNLNFDISFNKLDGLFQVNEVLKSFKVYPEIST
jgi:non-canonical poly(A) RNA polymerase PAPD5/7